MLSANLSSKDQQKLIVNDITRYFNKWLKVAYLVKKLEHLKIFKVVS